MTYGTGFAQFTTLFLSHMESASESFFKDVWSWGHFWHMILIQLFMLFHMVASVLLSIVAFSTLLLLVKICLKPIIIFEIAGYVSCHRDQNEGYHVEEQKNWIRNWCQMWPWISFEAIYREIKQCPFKQNGWIEFISLWMRIVM